jgi:circadian clock protein KaiC
VRQVDPAELSPGMFAHEVSKLIDQGVRVLVIDSLNGYLNAMPQDNFLTAQLHELLSYLSNKGVTTFLVVAQHGSMLGGNTASQIDASYLADSVVMLRYFEHHGGVKKAISVMKKRTGGHEESIRQLTFCDSGIRLSEPLLQLRGVLTGVPVEIGGEQRADAPAAYPRIS